jgi:hypothetical protein
MSEQSPPPTGHVRRRNRDRAAERRRDRPVPCAAGPQAAEPAIIVTLVTAIAVAACPAAWRRGRLRGRPRKAILVGRVFGHLQVVA